MTYTFHLPITREDPKTRVYLSQLPIGITPLELREAFGFFGEIAEVSYVTKLIHGHRAVLYVC